MMNQTALDRIDALAKEGKLPSYEELENALLQALKERKIFRDSTLDMSLWLSKMAAAHVHDDSAKVFILLDLFIQKHIRLKPNSETESMVH